MSAGPEDAATDDDELRSGYVGWLRRKRHRPGTVRPSSSADLDHLSEFAKSRTGVEAYLEPRTAITETTVVLVASTGEWTRRRIGGADAARSFAKKHAIPIYDGALVGYPQRMRDWTAHRKANGELGPPSSPGSAV